MSVASRYWDRDPAATTLEDRVIFIHDMETIAWSNWRVSTGRSSRSGCCRNIKHPQAARILHCTRRTIERAGQISVCGGRAEGG